MILFMATSPPVWDDKLLQNPHTVGDKRRRVQAMFSAIAPKYDLNNHLHSFGRDQAWRRKAVEVAAVKPGDFVVDVACGTGDLSFAFADKLDQLAATAGDADRATNGLRGVLAIDFTFGMLPIAIDKAHRRRSTANATDATSTSRRVPTRFVNGDAQSLCLPDGVADVVSIAFGIRNVQDVAAALQEFYRVLKPGGRVIILEFARPPSRVVRFFNDLYCSKIMPITATWISGDTSGAYKYLPKSVESFIDRPQMVQMMSAAGFKDIQQFPMTFGACVCYRGVR